MVLLWVESLCASWGMYEERRGLWLALGTAFFTPARALHMWCAVCFRLLRCLAFLRRCGVAFFRGSNDLDWSMWRATDPVEVRCRGTNRKIRCGRALFRHENGVGRLKRCGTGERSNVWSNYCCCTCVSLRFRLRHLVPVVAGGLCGCRGSGDAGVANDCGVGGSAAY